MSEHLFPDDAERCQHCGTLKSNTMQTICPGQQGIPTPSGLMPEPALRQRAADDADAISTHLARLKAERAAAWNTIEEETE